MFSIDLRSLAVFRMALGGLLLVDLASRARDLSAHYHLAQTQAAGALALETTARYEMLAPDGLKLLTEIIDITEHFQ